MCVFSLSEKGITATCYGTAAVAMALLCVDRLLEKSVWGGTTFREQQSSPFFSFSFSFLEELFPDPPPQGGMDFCAEQ